MPLPLKVVKKEMFLALKAFKKESKFPGSFKAVEVSVLSSTHVGRRIP